MFTKQFLKTKPVCKVRFRLSKERIGNIDTVHLAGDFNQWDTRSMSMKKLKNGDFTYTLDLEKGSEYQFRYLLNQEKWINDETADAYVPSGYPEVENSVISLAQPI